MGQCSHEISLGVTGQSFQPGVHVCQIFSDDDERQESLLRFILSGLQGGERTACFSEHAEEEAVAEFLMNYGISFSEVRQTGALSLSGVRDVYFEGSTFNPEKMLGLIQRMHEDTMVSGYKAARIIGEMLPEVHDLPGGSRLMEYESRVTMMLRKYPVTAVCQYDARVFDGETILEVLKVHPLMIVRGSIVQNPFHIPPETYLNCDA